MPMNFPRAVRLDGSDLEAFVSAAEPGEWAIPGTFVFVKDGPETLTGKRLQAFRSGFLGTSSFGWCTLVEIAEIDEDEFQAVIDRLAQHLMREHGAPHVAAALPVAAEEAHYASGICTYPAGTLLAIERNFRDDGVVESLKRLRTRDGVDHSEVKLWGSE